MLRHISARPVSFCLTLILAGVALSFPAYAGSGGAAFAAIICKVVRLVSNDIARPAATAAVLGITGVALFGRISWGVVIVTIMGISIVFSAGMIVKAVTGKTGCGGILSGVPDSGMPGHTITPWNPGPTTGSVTTCSSSILCASGLVCIDYACRLPCDNDYVCKKVSAVCDLMGSSPPTRVCVNRYCPLSTPDCGTGPGATGRFCNFRGRCESTMDCVTINDCPKGALSCTGWKCEMPSSSSSSGGGGNCNTLADCPVGTGACLGGKCVTSCNILLDCPAGAISCTSNVCIMN